MFMHTYVHVDAYSIPIFISSICFEATSLLERDICMYTLDGFTKCSAGYLNSPTVGCTSQSLSTVHLHVPVHVCLWLSILALCSRPKHQQLSFHTNFALISSNPLKLKLESFVQHYCGVVFTVVTIAELEPFSFHNPFVTEIG